MPLSPDLLLATVVLFPAPPVLITKANPDTSQSGAVRYCGLRFNITIKKRRGGRPRPRGVSARAGETDRMRMSRRDDGEAGAANCEPRRPSSDTYDLATVPPTDRHAHRANQPIR